MHSFYISYPVRLAFLLYWVFILILMHFNYVQEKAANAMALTSDHVRWVMGPSGTVVTFPNEMGLPSIFDSKPCRYQIFYLANLSVEIFFPL